MTLTKTRQEVKSQDKWNVEAFFPSFSAWEKEFARFGKDSKEWKELLSLRGKLSSDIATFKKALELKLHLERAIEKLYVYAHLRNDENITDPAAKTAFEKISSQLSDFNCNTAWFEPEILSFSEEIQQRYLASSELKSYRFYLEKIVRMAPHTLSADKEEILANAAKPLKTSSKAFSSLNNADIKFQPVLDSKKHEHPLTHGLFNLYLRSQDGVLRKNAFHEMMGRFLNYENTLAELISGEIEKHVFYAKVRGFSSSLEAALFPHNIPETVYRSLITTVRKKGIPLLHRYVALRKKVLKLPKIHLYDMYVPLLPSIDFSMNYEEAEKLVIQASSPLGVEYQNLLQKGLLEERWVDKYENTNKRSGAYSSGCYDSFPYILMNYRGTLRDVFTLAHEAGHSMHSLLSHQHQKYHNAQYPIFVAEVASTFNEELLMDFLLKRAEKKEEKLFLINEKIEDIRATFFRQTMFAEFELMLHELVEKGIPLTPTLIKEKYLELNKDYFGPEMTFDDEASIEWARIPHFYYNFYVYQYATGISAALTLAQRVLKQEGASREDFLAFLSSGGSLFPIDLLKIAGIDMTKPEPIESLLKSFEHHLKEFESII